MLNKGIKDEESIRIDNCIKKLLSLVFTPETESNETEEALKGLSLTTQNLIDFNEQELIDHLLTLHLDWNQLENFADFLIEYSTVESDYRFVFSVKAIAIYNYIQQESKTFSFAIFNKIVSANK